MSSDRGMVQSVVDAVPDVVYAFDRDGRYLWGNRRLRDVTGYTEAELQGMDPLDFVPAEDRGTILSLIERVVSEESTEYVETHLVTKEGVDIAYEFTGAPLIVDGEVIGIAGVGRDASDRDYRRTELEQERTLHGIGRSIDRELVAATTRAEIETAVCESLADVAPYSGATVWARRGEDGGFELNAAVGDAGSAAELLGVDGDPEGPASRAIRSGAVIPVPTPEERDGPDEGTRGSRVSDGERPTRLAAVPIATGERAFGVLGVTATCGLAFTDRERELLAEMGTRVADAIQSAVTRQLLYADTVTEIEVRTTDPNAAFVDLSRETGGRFELERAIGFDELVVYETVTGTTVDRVLELAAADDRFDHVECLNSNGGGHTMEFRMADREGTLTAVFTRHGARTIGAIAEKGIVTVTVELPPDQDPREVIDAVRDRFPGTELASIRESKRSDAIDPGVRRRIDEALTEKQRAALDAAIAGGYFEWPARESTAEEIAGTLDIAPQTLHQHLRIAQRKLLEVVLDGDVGS